MATYSAPVPPLTNGDYKFSRHGNVGSVTLTTVDLVGGGTVETPTGPGVGDTVVKQRFSSWTGH